MCHINHLKYLLTVVLTVLHIPCKGLVHLSIDLMIKRINRIKLRKVVFVFYKYHMPTKFDTFMLYLVGFFVSTEYRKIFSFFGA